MAAAQRKEAPQREKAAKQKFVIEKGNIYLDFRDVQYPSENSASFFWLFPFSVACPKPPIVGWAGGTPFSTTFPQGFLSFCGNRNEKAATTATAAFVSQNQIKRNTIEYIKIMLFILKGLTPDARAELSADEMFIVFRCELLAAWCHHRRHSRQAFSLSALNQMSIGFWCFSGWISDMT